MTLQPGIRLGRYEILAALGHGGMATVYKALQPSLKRVVALKVMRAGLAEDAEFVERFRREAAAIASLEHPHIVQVHDFEELEGRYLLVMQHLEGGTLKDWLAGLARAGARVPAEEVTGIVHDVAEALAYAHARGIVHRDIKPSNIMFAHDGRAVVTDFGIAKILAGTQYTQTGVGIGTPEYMSPEQGQGLAIDQRSDIYALGVVAYELLTGRVPFTADTPMAVIFAHVRDPLPPPSKLNPAIGRATERVLLRALAKDVGARFPEAREFAAELRRALAEDERGATVATLPLRARLRVPRKPPAVRVPLTGQLPPRPVLLGGLAAVLALLAAAVLARPMGVPELAGARPTQRASTAAPSPSPSPSSALGRVVATIPVEGIGYRQLAVDSRRNLVYGPAFFADQAIVIDGSSDRVAATVRVARASSVDVNPTTGRAYVGNVSGDRFGLFVIDGTGSLLGTLALGEARPGSFTSSAYVAVNAATNRVYVAGDGAGPPHAVTGAPTGLLWVIDGAQQSLVATVSLRANAYGVVVNPSTNRVYVRTAADSLTVFDGASHAVLGVVPVGARFGHFKVNPVANRLYATTSDGIAIIDGSSNAVVGTIAVPGAGAPTRISGLAVDVAASRLYVTVTLEGSSARRTQLSLVDLRTSTIVASMEVSGGEIAINEVTRRLYVTSDVVTVIELAK